MAQAEDGDKTIPVELPDSDKPTTGTISNRSTRNSHNNNNNRHSNAPAEIASQDPPLNDSASDIGDDRKLAAEASIGSLGASADTKHPAENFNESSNYNYGGNDTIGNVDGTNAGPEVIVVGPVADTTRAVSSASLMGSSEVRQAIE